MEVKEREREREDFSSSSVKKKRLKLNEAASIQPGTFTLLQTRYIAPLLFYLLYSTIYYIGYIYEFLCAALVRTNFFVTVSSRGSRKKERILRGAGVL